MHVRAGENIASRSVRALLDGGVLVAGLRVLDLLAHEATNLGWRRSRGDVVLLGCVLQDRTVVNDAEAAESPGRWLNAVEDIEVLLALGWRALNVHPHSAGCSLIRVDLRA